MIGSYAKNQFPPTIGHDPANITSLQIVDSNMLLFDNLRFEYRGDPAQYQTDVVVYDSASIAITNSTFKGVALGLADDSDSEAQSALLVQGATDFTFANNEVSRYFHGIAVLESENTSIVGNDIHSMQGDGSRFAQVNDLLIQDNKFHDFFGPYTTHNDYIQFWTSGTTAPSTDITIRDNLIASAEFQSQAIFFPR